MVKAIRVEAQITAQSKLRPGLAQAAAEMGRFRAMQARAMAAFGSTTARALRAFQQKRDAIGSAAQAGMLAGARSQLLAIGGPAALGAAYKRFADVDRGITRIGITAGASAEELAGVRKQIEGIAFETAQSSSNVTGGLDVLVAQGRNLKDSLAFLPSVARTAAATGAEVDDIARSADAVATNFKIAGKDMQSAFDIMAAGGNAGSFELKDQARYLPSIAPAAAAVGFNGTGGLAQLVALLQVMRKGSGSSEEAASSLNNIFQKMDSDETRKRFQKFGIDSSKALAKARKEGKNLVDVFGDLTDQALKGDMSKLPRLFGDMEMARGMRALMTYRKELKALIDTINSTAKGTVDQALTRVTNDARAQIDKMFSAVENRAVEVGGVLAKYIVLPLDKALRDIEEGKNPAVNRMNEWSKSYVSDLTANSELDSGHRYDIDAESRRVVEARKEFLMRQRIEDEKARLEREVTDLRAKRKTLADDTSAGNEILPSYLAEANSARAGGEIGAIDEQIAATTRRLEEFNALVAAVNELNLKIAEVQGARDKAMAPSMSLPNLTTDVGAMAEAGRNAGRQFTDALTAELGKATAEIAPEIARIKAMLNFRASPSIGFSVTGAGGVGGFNTGKQGPD